MRGFDIDHGTDVSILIDGMPVNMVSHAHGQGYADLHFVMPELLEKMQFDKGPNFAGYGNLATAGYVSLQTPDFLQKQFVELEVLCGPCIGNRNLYMWVMQALRNRVVKPAVWVQSKVPVISLLTGFLPM